MDSPSSSLLTDAVVYLFEIETTLKGNLIKQTVEVASGIYGGSCGYYFEMGKSYLVYARNFTGSPNGTSAPFEYETSLCDRNQEMAYVHKKELRKLRRLNR